MIWIKNVFFIHVQYLRTMEIQISLINSYLAFCFLFFFCDNVIAIRCIYMYKTSGLKRDNNKNKNNSKVPAFHECRVIN